MITKMPSKMSGQYIRRCIGYWVTPQDRLHSKLWEVLVADKLYMFYPDWVPSSPSSPNRQPTEPLLSFVRSTKYLLLKSTTPNLKIVRPVCFRQLPFNIAKLTTIIPTCLILSASLTSFLSTNSVVCFTYLFLQLVFRSLMSLVSLTLDN